MSSAGTGSIHSKCVTRRFENYLCGYSGQHGTPAFLEWGRNKELLGIAEKVVQAMKMEVEENGVKLSITQEGKERGRSLRHAAISKRRFRNAATEEEQALQPVLKTSGVPCATKKTCLERRWREPPCNGNTCNSSSTGQVVLVHGLKFSVAFFLLGRRIPVFQHPVLGDVP